MSAPTFEIRVYFRLLDSDRNEVAVLATHEDVVTVPRIGESYLIGEEYDVRVIDVEHNILPGEHHIRLRVEGVILDAATLIPTLTGKAGGWLLLEGGHNLGNGSPHL